MLQLSNDLMHGLFFIDLFGCRYPRAQVILSSDQVANLIDDVTITGLPLSPGPTASQITASTTPATVSLGKWVVVPPYWGVPTTSHAMRR